MQFTAREMLEKLIGFDTTSRNSNLDLIKFVEDYFSSFGVPYELVFNAEKTKANLYATIGPNVPGGVVLSGHTDVVPIDGQDWVTEPFSVVEKEGKLFGRGTTDMKGFISVALSLVPEMVKLKLETPLHFALSYDEEVGCLGVPSLVDHISAHLPKPKLVLVGEATNMKVVNAHKGLHAFRTIISGREAHSSAPHLGASAIVAAASLIEYLSKKAEELAEAGRTGSRFHPPYTTLNVGRIDGGSAVNIIPKSCFFDWEFRILPDEDPDALITGFETFAQETVLPKLKQNEPSAKIETVNTAIIPPLMAEENSPAESLALMLAQQNETFAVAYGTEAGIFQRADIPAVVCGPGDIAQAHQPNEFIEISELEACEAFLRRLMAYMSP